MCDTNKCKTKQKNMLFVEKVCTTGTNATENGIWIFNGQKCVMSINVMHVN